MRLLEKSSQLARGYRTEVRVCPSGKSVGPKFLSSNGVLAHRRIAEEYASIRELIASVSTSAFVVTYLVRFPTTTSGPEWQLRLE
jgi:hypothetical protein